MLNQTTLGGRYKLLSHLGGGGFGQTYLAEDWHLPGNPRCVVKQLKLRKVDGISMESARRLFDAEAEALYRLGSHDQIPRLMAHFEENEQFYLVQEFVAGTVLSSLLKLGQRWEESQTLNLIEGLLNTLSFVHQHQVIHRDLKPSNLILRHSDQRLVLIDFGSVKQVNTQPVETDGQVSITIAIGSMGYMPNEQLAGQPCLSSDIYAVGMLAIQALTGIEPKRLRKDPKTSEIRWREFANVSDAFAEIIETMVRYDFRQRYPSATEASAALLPLLKSAEETLIFELVPTHPEQAVVPNSSVSISSSNHWVWLEQGEELLSQERYREAVDCYNQVIAVDTQNPMVWFKQGIALENLKEFEAAVYAYTQVTQLQPDDYLAWAKKGTALQYLGQYEAALAAYEEASHLHPDNYWVWHDRAQLLEKLERFEDAIAAEDRAIQLQPNFQMAQTSRKRILLRLKRVEQLYQLQHYDAAIDACNHNLKANPHDTSTWFMRGMALEKLSRLPEAALSYNQVTKQQPDDHVAWFKLAEVLAKLNRLQQAAIAYGQVVRIHPHNHWAWYQRGQLLAQLQNFKAAIAAYNCALQPKPDLKAAIAARQGLLDHLIETRSPLSAPVAIAASNTPVNVSLTSKIG
ncbi:MAG: serine/threonine-protein kinase [Cyanobacteria bacterium J06635_15]